METLLEGLGIGLTITLGVGGPLALIILAFAWAEKINRK